MERVRDTAYGRVLTDTIEETTMTQYLLSVWHDRDATPEDIYPTAQERDEAYAATGAFNEELQASGSWVFAGGLHPPATATVVDGTGTDVVMTDGPFSEAKEQIGGFWVVEAADLDAALDLAARGSKACRGKVEVRPFQGE
ncbi:MAG TPA: YciI family protein [Ornithinibacter sp.]|nr:YciI family protein [Ornithinibacter sp.]